jgi:hypothetical protein
MLFPLNYKQTPVIRTRCWCLSCSAEVINIEFERPKTFVWELDYVCNQVMLTWHGSQGLLMPLKQKRSQGHSDHIFFLFNSFKLKNYLFEISHAWAAPKLPECFQTAGIQRIYLLHSGQFCWLLDLFDGVQSVVKSTRAAPKLSSVVRAAPKLLVYR